MHTHKRSIAKSITWRVLATLVTMISVLIFTGDLVLAGSVGLLDTLAKLIIYYLHERAWESTRWGVES